MKHKSTYSPVPSGEAPESTKCHNEQLDPRPNKPHAVPRRRGGDEIQARLTQSPG